MLRTLLPVNLGVRHTGMTTIRIKHKSSYVTAYVFLTFIAILLIKSILNETIEKADLFVIYVAGCMAAISWWVKFTQAKRWIEIDATLNKVVVHRKSVLFVSKITEHPLDEFSAVRSFITPGRHPMNQVELVTKSGGEALEVASLQPASIAKSFFSVPVDSENNEAAALRTEIAYHTNLADHGFLGTRMIGAQIDK